MGKINYRMKYNILKAVRKQKLSEKIIRYYKKLTENWLRKSQINHFTQAR